MPHADLFAYSKSAHMSNPTWRNSGNKLSHARRAAHNHIATRQGQGGIDTVDTGSSGVRPRDRSLVVLLGDDCASDERRDGVISIVLPITGATLGDLLSVTSDVHPVKGWLRERYQGQLRLISPASAQRC